MILGALAAVLILILLVGLTVLRISKAENPNTELLVYVIQASISHDSTHPACSNQEM